MSCLEEDADHYGASLSLGNFYFRMGENLHAAKFYNNAIRVAPRSINPQIGLMASIIAETRNGDVAIYSFDSKKDL